MEYGNDAAKVNYQTGTTASARQPLGGNGLSPQRDRLTIAAQLDRQDKITGQLFEELYGLENQLQPALSPAPPGTMASGAEEQSPQVRERLERHFRQLNILCALVNSLRQRVEL